jgi:hypothetical protein
MRLEDFGKKLMANIPAMSEESVKEILHQYLVKNFDVKYHLLLGKEISYYTVFNTVTVNSAENIYDYLNCSFYEVDGVMVPMSQVSYMELRDDGCLEIFIGKVYFHLAPFDWGVERV